MLVMMKVLEEFRGCVWASIGAAAPSASKHTPRPQKKYLWKNRTHAAEPILNAALPRPSLLAPSPDFYPGCACRILSGPPGLLLPAGGRPNHRRTDVFPA